MRAGKTDGTFGAGCACEANRTLGTYFTLDTLQTLRTGKTDQTLRAYFTLDTLQTLRTRQAYGAFGAGKADQTLRADFALDTLQPLRACQANGALGTYFTLDALDALQTLRTCQADGALRTFGTGCTCETDQTLRANFALNALRAGSTGVPLLALGGKYLPFGGVVARGDGGVGHDGYVRSAVIGYDLAGEVGRHCAPVPFPLGDPSQIAAVAAEGGRGHVTGIGDFEGGRSDSVLDGQPVGRLGESRDAAQHGRKNCPAGRMPQDASHAVNGSLVDVQTHLTLL